MTDRKAILTIDGEEPIELPVLKGTRGQDVIDVGSLGSHRRPASQILPILMARKEYCFTGVIL